MMATIKHTAVNDSNGVTLTWAGMSNGDQGAVTAPSYRQASFQATGTFGAGGSVRLEGSNDGISWFGLTPAALMAPGLFAALGANEHPKHIRPIVTAGDDTTLITVVGWYSH